jgi:dihydroorotate dehydrogenase electron transfer subunit
MARQHTVVIADHRQVTPRLRWLALHVPDLARDARPGHALLVWCNDPGDTYRLLRRPLFVAAALPEIGQVALLYEPDEPGLAWLARRSPGETLDVIGLCGRALLFTDRQRNLLLLGAGAGLAALIFAARFAPSHTAVTLIAIAGDQDSLPPPFLLPSAVEYETIVNSDLMAAGVAVLQPATGASPLTWADAVVAALPRHALAALGKAIRAVRLRQPRGFAHALIESPPGCGFGACGVCAVELRSGVRLPCVEGPWFDLREVRD